jgi:hypothetical protein
MQMQSASGLLAHTIAQRSTKLTDFSDEGIEQQTAGRGHTANRFPPPWSVNWVTISALTSADRVEEQLCKLILSPDGGRERQNKLRRKD